MRSITQELLHHVRERPDAVFCTFLCAGRTEQITFAEVFQRSCSYAIRYRQLGIARGDLVLIILQHSPHLFYSFIGAMLAGAIPSFMPFPSPKQRSELYWQDHAELFDRIQPRILVTYERNLVEAQAAIPNLSVEMLIADDGILSAGSTDTVDYPGLQAKSSDIACLQHSSGTTSLKRGVILTHQAVLDQVASYSKAIAFGPSDSIASWLPLYHDMGFIACFMASIIEGTHLVALDPFEWVVRPQLLLDAIQKYKTTFCWLPNFAFSHIVKTTRPSSWYDLSSIRAFINCSEPCKQQTFARFVDRFRDCGVREQSLQVCYAMAENVFGVTQTPLDCPVTTIHVDPSAFALGDVRITSASPSSLSIISCGRPISGVRLAIHDASGSILKDGKVGEIHVASDFLFDGYYKLPGRTSEKLRAGWYATGDLGFMHDGDLYVAGRMDDLIIVTGRNYYAHEIEAIVNTVASVLPGRNVAIGIHDANTDATALAVLAECVDGADHRQVSDDVRRRVLEKMGVSVHSVVPLTAGELIKTTSGKISRLKNKELYLDGRSRGQDHHAI
jgi:fatty-acyl-CoA synthase